MKTKVSIAHCPDYEQENINKAISNCLSAIGGIESIIKPNTKVLLKVNMISAVSPECATTTHPAVLKAVVNEVLKVGAVPLIGDSPGNAYINIDNAYEITGYKRVAQETGVKIIKFEEYGVEKIEINHAQVKYIYISRAVLDTDAIISIPKLKTHNLTYYTGAIKNMFGSVPGFNKGQMHMQAIKVSDFAEILIEIFSRTKPILSIMDGVIGMEGAGPTAGTPRQVGIIGASTDAVAIDAVFGQIIGYPPEMVPTTRIAGQKGLGESKLENIEIIGANLQDLLIKDYKLTSESTLLLKYIPQSLLNFLTPLLKKIVRVHPDVQKDKCKACHVCEKNCAVKAMNWTQTDNIPIWDEKKCIYCYCCHELCPHHAIDLKHSWLAQKIMGRFKSSSN